jgi:peptidoglycan/LPS O-acetylase OafA/YrhL
VGYTAIAVFCACLVYLAWKDVGIFVKLASSRMLRFFGRYSYGLYIYHGLLIAPLFPLVYPIQRIVHSVLLGGVLYILLSLGLATLIAVASYHFFEAPILRLKKRFV